MKPVVAFFALFFAVFSASFCFAATPPYSTSVAYDQFFVYPVDHTPADDFANGKSFTPSDELSISAYLTNMLPGYGLNFYLENKATQERTFCEGRTYGEDDDLALLTTEQGGLHGKNYARRSEFGCALENLDFGTYQVYSAVLDSDGKPALQADGRPASRYWGPRGSPYSFKLVPETPAVVSPAPTGSKKIIKSILVYPAGQSPSDNARGKTFSGDSSVGVTTELDEMHSGESIIVFLDRLDKRGLAIPCATKIYRVGEDIIDGSSCASADPADPECANEGLATPPEDIPAARRSSFTCPLSKLEDGKYSVVVGPYDDLGNELLQSDNSPTSRYWGGNAHPYYFFYSKSGKPLPPEVTSPGQEGTVPAETAKGGVYGIYVDTAAHAAFGEYKDANGAEFEIGKATVHFASMVSAVDGASVKVSLVNNVDGTSAVLCASPVPSSSKGKVPVLIECPVAGNIALKAGEYFVFVELVGSDGAQIASRYWASKKYAIKLTGVSTGKPVKVEQGWGYAYRIEAQARAPSGGQEATAKIGKDSQYYYSAPGGVSELPLEVSDGSLQSVSDLTRLKLSIYDKTNFIIPVGSMPQFISFKNPFAKCSAEIKDEKGLSPVKSQKECASAPNYLVCGGEGKSEKLEVRYCLISAKKDEAPKLLLKISSIKSDGIKVEEAHKLAIGEKPVKAGEGRLDLSNKLFFDSKNTRAIVAVKGAKASTISIERTLPECITYPDGFAASKEGKDVFTMGLHYNPLCQVCGPAVDVLKYDSNTGAGQQAVKAKIPCAAENLVVTTSKVAGAFKNTYGELSVIGAKLDDYMRYHPLTTRLAVIDDAKAMKSFSFDASKKGQDVSVLAKDAKGVKEIIDKLLFAEGKPPKQLIILGDTTVVPLGGENSDDAYASSKAGLRMPVARLQGYNGKDASDSSSLSKVLDSTLLAFKGQIPNTALFAGPASEASKSNAALNALAKAYSGKDCKANEYCALAPGYCVDNGMSGQECGKEKEYSDSLKKAGFIALMTEKSDKDGMYSVGKRENKLYQIYDAGMTSGFFAKRYELPNSIVLAVAADGSFNSNNLKYTLGKGASAVVALTFAPKSTASYFELGKAFATVAKAKPPKTLGDAFLAAKKVLGAGLRLYGDPSIKLPVVPAATGNGSPETAKPPSKAEVAPAAGQTPYMIDFGYYIKREDSKALGIKVISGKDLFDDSTGKPQPLELGHMSLRITPSAKDFWQRDAKSYLTAFSPYLYKIAADGSVKNPPECQPAAMEDATGIVGVNDVDDCKDSKAYFVCQEKGEKDSYTIKFCKATTPIFYGIVPVVVKPIDIHIFVEKQEMAKPAAKAIAETHYLAPAAVASKPTALEDSTSTQPQVVPIPPKTPGKTEPAASEGLRFDFGYVIDTTPDASGDLSGDSQRLSAGAKEMTFKYSWRPLAVSPTFTKLEFKVFKGQDASSPLCSGKVSTISDANGIAQPDSPSYCQAAPAYWTFQEKGAKVKYVVRLCDSQKHMASRTAKLLVTEETAPAAKATVCAANYDKAVEADDASKPAVTQSAADWGDTFRVFTTIYGNYNGKFDYWEELTPSNFPAKFRADSVGTGQEIILPHTLVTGATTVKNPRPAKLEVLIYEGGKNIATCTLSTEGKQSYWRPNADNQDCKDSPTFLQCVAPGKTQGLDVRYCDFNTNAEANSFTMTFKAYPFSRPANSIISTKYETPKVTFGVGA